MNKLRISFESKLQKQPSANLEILTAKPATNTFMAQIMKKISKHLTKKTKRHQWAQEESLNTGGSDGWDGCRSYDRVFYI